MRKRCFALLSLAFASTCLSAQTQTGPAPALHKRVALSEYGKLPLSFEANLGQTDGQVKFLSRGSGFSLFLTNDEAVIDLKKTGPSYIDPRRRVLAPTRMADTDGSSASVKLHMQLLGANMASRVEGAAELPGKVNYFIGNDPAKWRTNIPTYAQVKYEDVYPGVDLIYYGNQGRLEYDFVVAPGADPGLIALRFRGSRDVAIDQHGNLLLNSEDVCFQKPLVYQDKEGARKAVESQYVMTADNTIRFTVGDYDRGKPLVIDPVLVYSTYLGGGGSDFGVAIAADDTGNAYLTGGAGSIDFPIVNAIQPNNAALGSFPSNVFISKINPSGSALVYSTYLGGRGPDEGFGIAVDPSGNAYVTGAASSFDFPTVNALQPVSRACCGPTSTTGFVAKLNAAGSALIYSTYLGGVGEDFGSAIAADAAGNAYVTGLTTSPNQPCDGCNFPTTANALQPTSAANALGNAFVTKINPNGSALVFSTYLGGSGGDEGRGIAVDTAGNVYVAGSAGSKDFPIANALQPNRRTLSAGNGFVSKINPSGSVFVYSTYLGGSGPGGDRATDIAVDAAGNAYVVGGTSSADFTTVNPLQSTLKGFSDAFLTKINSTGSAFVYSTFLGGNRTDDAVSVAVDQLGNAYIAGSTLSNDFPTVNAPQSIFGGGDFDSFVAEINSGGNALVYSTYLGGSGNDFTGGIALDPLGNVYVSGRTNSTNFPTVNALQTALGGRESTNGFVAKIASTVAARLNVVIDGCDSGVTNAVLPSGRTISDLIAECAKDASNHGQFVSCVAHVTNGLREDRTISGQQKGAIQSCAAQAHIP